MAFEALKERLEHNGFTVHVFETKEEAADYLDEAIDGTTVGSGGSVTLQELGVLPRLARHNQFFNHGGSPDPELAKKNAAKAEVYLLSANAIAEDTGEILNIDGVGNRVSSSLWGHSRLYFVAGKNKISPDFNSALWRLRNIVAPKNAQRLHRNTPCAARADRCYNCSSPERICNALVVHYKRMMGSMAQEVILINEDLGY